MVPRCVLCESICVSSLALALLNITVVLLVPEEGGGQHNVFLPEVVQDFLVECVA